MNLEHVEAVKARIQAIERRFAPLESANARPSVSFQQVLTKAVAPVQLQCPSDLEPLVDEASRKYGVDASLIKSVIQTESGFRANAVSPAGAQGLMQLMPGTSRDLGVDPFDPSESIDGGTRYLRQLLDRFGDTQKAVAAYNAGPGAVARYGGVPPYAETQRYVGSVMGLVDKYNGK